MKSGVQNPAVNPVQNPKNNYQKGLDGQNLVQKYLEGRGFELVCANFQFYWGVKMGEIDLIMAKAGRLHLIEVKTRTNSKFGQIHEQITKTKLQALSRAWQYFIFKNPRFKNAFCQFDAALVQKVNKNDIFEEAIKGGKNEEILENHKIEMIFNAYQFDW